MSIIIEGMDKPRDCYECPFAISYLDCLMSRKYTCSLDKDGDECPLIEVNDDALRSELLLNPQQMKGE